MNKIPNTLAAAAMLALAAAALPAAAQSADFGAWTAYGDVLTGGTAAVLTTASLEAVETPISGHSAVFWYEIEGPLGVSFDVDTLEGSAIAASFSALAGTRVDVGWALSSLEQMPGDYPDRAYVVVDGQVQTLAGIDSGAQSGLFSTTFASSGTHTLAFAVFDVNDVLGTTTLALSGLTVTAVPEPATTALLLAGLAVVGAAARRRG